MSNTCRCPIINSTDAREKSPVTAFTRNHDFQRDYKPICFIL